MMYPLVGELAAPDAPIRVPVVVTCRVLGFSRQSYYQWLKAPVSDRDLDDAYATNAAFEIHGDDPEFGYRFIADELTSLGYRLSERRVWRLCRDQRLWSVHARKRGRYRKPGPPVHDDRVRQVFTAVAPNWCWLADITEHPTAEGKLYLCAVKDLFAGRIVGYSMADRMTADLAVDAITSAVRRRGDPAGCIVHTDRGSQFRSRKFVEALHQHHLVGSMGRVATAVDNAPIEAFFSLLQKNVLDRRRWATRLELRLAIVTWIERTYHRRRRQRRLTRLTPIEYEKMHQAAPAA